MSFREIQEIFCLGSYSRGHESKNHLNLVASWPPPPPFYVFTSLQRQQNVTLDIALCNLHAHGFKGGKAFHFPPAIIKASACLPLF